MIAPIITNAVVNHFGAFANLSPASVMGPPEPGRILAVVATVLVVDGQLGLWRSLPMRSDGRRQPSVFRGRSLISAATSARRSAL
jgi:hypothetical protein